MAPDLIAGVAEQMLLDRATSGDRPANTEVSARAMAGSLRCQQWLLGQLANAYLAGQLTAPAYLERAEVLARYAAGSGLWVERRRLAALLDVKALQLRADGADNASITAHVECLILLTRLADEGDEEASSMLNNLSPEMHPEALAVADMGMKAMRPFLTRPAAPPQPPALPEVEPFTVWERVSWRASDLCWSARHWLSDRLWSVKLRWWSIQDRFAEWGER